MAGMVEKHWGVVIAPKHFLSRGSVKKASLISAQFDELMCAVLRGEPVSWPATPCEGFEAKFIRRAEYQGVIALLNERASQISSWPGGVREQLNQRALAQAFWDLRHEQVIAEALAALIKKNIEPVLFKGTALAYGLYRNSLCRSRGDTDMIVASQDWSLASEILVGLGFQRAIGVSGELVSYQDCYIREFGGDRHAIDLHRKINNSQFLSRLFSYKELRTDARPLPDLCEFALAAGPVHALLLACFHPLTHKSNPYFVDGTAYYGGDRLIWYYDVHLLMQSFTQAQWEVFIEQATAKGLCAISLAGLEGAGVCFGTRCPEFVRNALTTRGERVAAYINAGPLHQGWLDFLSIPGFRKRLQFVQELVFPAGGYMRAKYGLSSNSWLPWFYGRRAIEGAIKRIRAVNRAASAPDQSRL